MPVTVHNPYSGQDDETCSVSFQAQQQMAGTVGSPQTEADYNKSKLLGEWGVIKGKLANGQIPNGTKVLSFTNTDSGSRGYHYVRGGVLWKKGYNSAGKLVLDKQSTFDNGETIIGNGVFSVSIPQAVSAKPKPEPVEVVFGHGKYISSLKFHAKDGEVIATSGSEYISFNGTTKKFELYAKDTNGFGYVKAHESAFLSEVMPKTKKWYAPDDNAGTPKTEPKTTTPPPSPTQVAAPTPAAPVNAGSDSPGSMSHEDVAAMFVKIKDDLAKEKGLNIKGANQALDEEVFKAIGNATGYTPAEVKAKIDAYKAAGNKLSALKKKVLAGTKQVPTGQPQKPASGPKPLVPGAGTGKPDPKPNGVPTVATPAVTNAVKQEVKQEAEAHPTKVYSDEDVAAQYIIAKDAVVAASNGKWTLYSKSDELDLEIAIKVGLKTGLNPTQQKVALANYLASGKKLSTLKKQLAKQGAFTPQADTLKKTKEQKTQEEKEAEVAAKAEAGYTPTPTPATGTPPVDTGHPMPVAPAKAARLAGDIGDIPDTVKAEVYATFKGTGSLSYLSAQNQSTYDALLSTQAGMQAKDQELSLLQILRIIDEQGAKKFGAENAKLFEKKTATWLTTPEAAAHLKANEVKLAKQAQQAKAKAEAEKAAKELEANQPPLPADSAQYQDWSLEKAVRISKTWIAEKPLTPGQLSGLKIYTGSAYVQMNGFLRGSRSDITQENRKAIEGAKAGMRPTTEPILVKRGAGLNQFEVLGVGRGEGSVVWGITGKTFKDEGFLSTSAGGRAAFGGEARLEIECPVGTPMMYVDPFSRHKGENEMLLQAGMEYKVLNVRKEGNTYVVRCRVVNWPGKAK